MGETPMPRKQDVAAAESSLQYVVLRHEGIPEPHFDLMMELKPEALLTTWRSDVWPLENKTRLTPLKEHRREYLSYEGELTGSRGHVRRVESGSVTLLHHGATMMIVRFHRPDGPQEWLIGIFPDHCVVFAPSGPAKASE
jgi:hypothetical protein